MAGGRRSVCWYGGHTRPARVLCLRAGEVAWESVERSQARVGWCWLGRWRRPYFWPRMDRSLAQVPEGEFPMAARVAATSLVSGQNAGPEAHLVANKAGTRRSEWRLGWPPVS